MAWLSSDFKLLCITRLMWLCPKPRCRNDLTSTSRYCAGVWRRCKVELSDLQSTASDPVVHLIEQDGDDDYRANDDLAVVLVDAEGDNSAADHLDD